MTTPELYLGAARADRFLNRDLVLGPQTLDAPAELPPDSFAFEGRWRITPEAAIAAGGSRLDLHFGARRVYLVLGTEGPERRVRVLLDGRPIGAAAAGADVDRGAVAVTSQRLYELVDLPRAGDHVLTLEPEAGVSGYAFTFG